MPTIAPPPTRRYRAFLTNVSYARDLIKAGQSLAVLEPGALDIGDLYRQAWVQSVSALDHWLHEELYDRVAELAARPDDQWPTQLKKFALPLSLVSSVLTGSTPIGEAVLLHVKSRWQFASLQNATTIAEALKLVTDRDIWGEAAAQIRAWHHNTTALDAKALKKRVHAIMERRNQIAHYADLEEGSLKQRREISAAAVSDTVDWIERIALALVTVLDTPSAASSGEEIPAQAT